VIGVVGLDRVEAGRDEAGDPLVVAVEDGMRERRHSTGGVNRGKRLVGPRGGAGHESSGAARQPSLEGFGGVGDMPTLDECARDPRPPDRRGRVGRRENRLSVEDDSMRRQPLEDLPHAIEPALPLQSEERQERGRRVVDEVAEDVDVGLVNRRRDFNAGHELEAETGAGGARPVDTRDRVVVGDPEDGYAGGGGSGDELLRRASPVGCRGVRVQIDHD
jgi:hypothetical protein